jgi:hypothetical protein
MEGIMKEYNLDDYPVQEDEDGQYRMIEGERYPLPPDGIRVTTIGGGYNEATSRLSHAPGTFHPLPQHKGLITKENASEMQQLRMQRAREAKERALIDGIREAYEQRGEYDTSINNSADAIYWAWMLMIREILADKDKQEWARLAVLEKLEEGAALTGRDQAVQGGVKIEANLTGDELKEIIHQLRNMKNSPQVIEGS